MKIVLTSRLTNEFKFRYQIPLRNISQSCKCQQNETLSLLHALRALYFLGGGELVDTPKKHSA